METRRYLKIIGQRWAIVVLATVVLVGLVAAGAGTGKGSFSAATTVTTSPPGEPRMLFFDSRTDGGARAPSLTRNVGELIGSLPVAERTVARLKLPITAHQLRTRIRVDQVPGSEIVRITVTGPDQASATLWANTVAAVAVEYNQELSRREATLTREFIERQAAIARASLDTVESELARFKEKHRIAPGPTTEPVTRASALASAWEDVRVRQSELRARAATLDRQLQAQGPVLKVEEATASNPTIQQLRKELADLEVQLVTARARYTNEHPDAIDLRKRVAAMTARLEAEMQRAFIQREPNPAYARLKQERLLLEVDRIAADARAEALRSALDRLGYQAPRFLKPLEEAQFNRLSRDVSVAEREYTTLRTKLNEARIFEQEAMNRGLLRVVDPARPVAQWPGFAGKMALALVAGLILGIALAFVAEHLDTRIRTLEQAEHLLGLPALGVIPRHNPPFENAHRRLRTRLRFLGTSGPPNVMAFVSPRPGDGRSTISAEVGKALANAGYSVVLVDADLHRPNLHTLFDLPIPVVGLNAMLRGSENVGDALQATTVPGLRLLPAGSRDGPPSELVGGRRMSAILDVLRKQAEVVIVDTPPAAICDESIPIALLCDAVIQLIPANIVPDGADVRLREELRAVGANVVGLVLTKAEPTSVDSYVYEYPQQKQRRWRWAVTGTSAVILVGAGLWLLRVGARHTYPKW